MHTTKLAVALALLLVGCSGKQKKDEHPLTGPVQVDGANLHFPEATVANSSVEAIRDAMQSACDGPCDRVFVDVRPETPGAVMEKVSKALASASVNPIVALLPPSGMRLEVVNVACQTTVYLEPEAGYVFVGGEMGRPDATCDVWDASICRHENRGLDWARLPTVAGDLDHVCVSLGEDGTGADVLAIHDELRSPELTFVADTRPGGAGISKEDVARSVKNRAADTDWCFQQVLEKTKPSEVTAKLAIDARGDVVRTVVKGTRSTPQFERCIDEVLMKIEFPPPEPAVVTIAEVPVEWTER